MKNTVEKMKEEIIWEIDKRQEEFIDFCCQIVRIPSENPPGNTTAVADFVNAYLKEKGFTTQVYEPQPDVVNLVSVIPGRQGIKNLVLNGHLDTFPAGNPKIWSFPPFCGEVRDGKILGRGVADMKGGLAALLLAFCIIQEGGIQLQGTLTLTVVSDEETGGRWGADWLLENVPGTLGNAVLDAEPSTTSAITLGGKGICRFKFRAMGPGGHGAYGSKENPILRMGHFLKRVMELDGFPVPSPKPLKKVFADSRIYIEGLPQGKGKGWVADSLVVNVGTIKGGLKRNLIPDFCEAEVDIRYPLGISAEEIRGKVEEIISPGSPDKIEFDLFFTPPSFTPPEEEIVVLTGKNAKEVTGQDPMRVISPGQQDTRFWIYRNIPGLNFGPRSYNMGAPDEYISVKDYLDTIKVHTCTILDYLGLGE